MTVAYNVKDYSITGTIASRQTVLFADLAGLEYDGQTIPNSFTTPPIVILSPDVDTKIIASTIGRDGFTVALSDLGILGVSSALCNIYIVDVAATPTFDTTIKEMSKLLGLYLLDEDEIRFNPKRKTLMLNWAQDKMVLLLTKPALFDMFTSVLAQSLDADDGYFDLTNLSTEIYSNDYGIIAIKITGGDFCDRISEEEYRKDVNNSVVYTASKPKYLMRGTKAYIYPFTSGTTTIDIYYLKKPSVMRLSDGGSQVAVDCVFGPKYQKIILGLACEDYIDTSKAAQRAFENASIMIQELNDKYVPTDAYNLAAHRTSEFVDDSEFAIQVQQYTV